MSRAIGLLLVCSLLLTACGGSVGKPTPTRIPGEGTLIFQELNDQLADQGTPTLTPGLDTDSMIHTKAAMTREALFRTPTLRPTFTAVPTSTPVPGLATQVYQGVNGTRAAEGKPTFTPGPSLDELRDFFIMQTLDAARKTESP